MFTFKDMTRIRNLVGDVSEAQLRHVDCFPGRRIGLFMPVGGVCGYAQTPEHTHPSYMFVFGFDRHSSVRIGDRIIFTIPGKIYVLPPYVTHHEMPSELPPRYLAIMVEEQFLKSELARYTTKAVIPPADELFPAESGLLPLLRVFMVEADNALPGKDTVLDALEVQICHSLIRSMVRVVPARDRVSERIEINRAIWFMHSTLGDKITTRDMARAAGMSVSHFARVFKAEMAVTPVEYLKSLRLERAKALLCSDGPTLTEVAHRCGFGSSAYLSTCFSLTFGLTPSDYRKTVVKGRIS